jgi:hypothetical protein
MCGDTHVQGHVLLVEGGSVVNADGHPAGDHGLGRGLA